MTVGARPRLHDYWRSSASYRVRIALAVKGIDYDRVPVDLLTGQQRRAENMTLNPQGLVPALEIDGLVLTQSLAIIEYLDDTRPTPPLTPRDPGARALVRAIALAVACEIHPLSNLSVLSRIEALAGSDARTAWNRDNISRGLAAVDALLDHPGFTGQFCYGDAPSIADCALIPQLYNAARWGVDYSALRRVRAVEDACTALPAFAAAHPDRFAPAAA